MARWAHVQLTPTQWRLVSHLMPGYFLVALALISLLLLIWPAERPLAPGWLGATLLAAPLAGLVWNWSIVRGVGALDRRLAQLTRALPDAETENPSAEFVHLVDTLDQLAQWQQATRLVLDDAARRNARLDANAADDSRAYQQVRSQLRLIQADVATLLADGPGTAAELGDLRDRLRLLERDLSRWHGTLASRQMPGSDEQLARWLAGKPLVALPASPPSWQADFSLEFADHYLKRTARLLSVKATLLFLWMFVIQTAGVVEVIVATVLTVLLSAGLFRSAAQAAAVVPLPATAESQPARQVRLQLHWRRASAVLLDAFWFSMLLLTWNHQAAASWAAATWLVVGLGLVIREGWQAVGVMVRAARPLPAPEQALLLQSVQRQSRMARAGALAILLLGWLCYTEQLVAFPPHDAITWLVTFSLVGSITRLVPPLTATWFERRWRPAGSRAL